MRALCLRDHAGKATVAPRLPKCGANCRSAEATTLVLREQCKGNLDIDPVVVPLEANEANRMRRAGLSDYPCGELSVRCSEFQCAGVRLLKCNRAAKELPRCRIGEQLRQGDDVFGCWLSKWLEHDTSSNYAA